MSIREIAKNPGPGEAYDAVSQAYFEQYQLEQRQYLIQLKFICDIGERTIRLAKIMRSLSSVQVCDLLATSYQLSQSYSPIGDAALLSSLPVDQIWKQQGVVILQGMFDELQSRGHYELLHIYLDMLIFRESSLIFIAIVQHFQQLSHSLYHATDDKRFHLPLPAIVRILQKICKTQGFRNLAFKITEFFDIFFRYKVSEDTFALTLGVLFAYKFNHVEKENIILDTSNILNQRLIGELIPTAFDLDLDIRSWEAILREQNEPRLDDITIEARKHFENMRTGERVEIARKVKGSELNLLLYDKSPIVVEALLDNPRLAELDIVGLTLRDSTPAEVLGKVAANPYWNCRYSIKNGIVNNRNAPFELANRFLADLLQNDLIAVVQKTELSWSIRRAAYFELQKTFEELTLADQLSLAEYSPWMVAEILLNTRDERILAALFYHARLKEAEIVRIVNWPETSNLLLERIGIHVSWGEIHPIKIGLLHNPHTPAYLKTRFLDHLSGLELRILAANTRLDELFRSLALRRWEALQANTSQLNNSENMTE